MPHLNEAFDIIIVGAGTAGCLLANRLSEDPSRRVLLVEAGGKPRSLWVDMPSGVAKLIFPGPYNWGFHTEAEPGLLGRQVYAPRGRGLGGSSLINGMAFFRAQARDYDAWAATGLAGWGWQDLFPLYKKMERRERGTPGYRGEAGELSIVDAEALHSSTLAFIEAGRSVGLAYNPDFNAASAEGIGGIQFNISNGVRHSADKAFLDPVVRQRSNLHVLTDARVCRVLFEGPRATGIECQVAGATRRLVARQEVILCAGTFGSPQLLKLSGIGPAAELQEHGIQVVRDLPAVGENLQDHMYIHSTFSSPKASSMNHEFRGLRAIGHGIRYLLTHGGPLTNGASQACAFVRSGDDVDRADLQITFRPMSWSFHPSGSMEIGRQPEMTVSVCNLRPFSRGRIALRSADPLDTPKIHAGYLSAERDQELAIRAVRWVRRLLGAEPMKAHVTAQLAPAPELQSDEAILNYVRQTAQSMHHWAGTCRMGADADAVVDAELKVRGVQGLRVADASVMPQIVSANTNAACFVIAEKLASLI